MTLPKILCIFILFLSNNCFIQGQRIETEKFHDLYKPKVNQPRFSAAENNKNELQVVFSGLYLFYKYFISSQDHVRCVFYPSCSTYGIESVKKNGLMIGGMAAFDRLTRCHGLAAHKYHIHEETQLLYDPVK